MDRAEHLAWAKRRALELVDAGDLTDAFASFTSDLNKHDDLNASATLQATLGFQKLMAGHLDSPAQMREWIEGFN